MARFRLSCLEVALLEQDLELLLTRNPYTMSSKFTLLQCIDRGTIAEGISGLRRQRCTWKGTSPRSTSKAVREEGTLSTNCIHRWGKVPRRKAGLRTTPLRSETPIPPIRWSCMQLLNRLGWLALRRLSFASFSTSSYLAVRCFAVRSRCPMLSEHTCFLHPAQTCGRRPPSTLLWG